MQYISAGQNIVCYTFEQEDNIDTTVKNIFALWSFEPGLQAPSGEGDGFPRDPISPEGAGGDDDGTSVGMIVGVVCGSLAVVALASGGFVYYRQRNIAGKTNDQ